MSGIHGQDYLWLQAGIPIALSVFQEGDLQIFRADVRIHKDLMPPLTQAELADALVKAFQSMKLEPKP